MMYTCTVPRLKLPIMFVVITYTFHGECIRNMSYIMALVKAKLILPSVNNF